MCWPIRAVERGTILEGKDKIHILLQEYNALRSEMLQRINAMMQWIVVGAAATIGLITLIWGNRTDPQLRFLVILLVVVWCLIFLGLIFLIRDRNKLSRRIRELEKDINHRAGETLLVWETRWGRSATGLRQPWKPLPPPPDNPSEPNP
jgi:fatty acid desaturase